MESTFSLKLVPFLRVPFMKGSQMMIISYDSG